MRDATILDEVGGGGTGGGDDEASLHHLLSSDPELLCKYSGNLDSLFSSSSDHLGSLPPEEGLDSSGDLLNHQLLQQHHSSTTSSLSAAVDAITSKSRNSSFCPREWDNLICWPETMAGQMATLPCFDELNGIFYDTTRNATRYCLEGGDWTKSDYSECRVLNNTRSGDDGSNLAITTGVYFFGYCVSLGALVIAILIFLAFKELRCLRNTIHTHLMITYVLADTLWIITSSTTITSSGTITSTLGSGSNSGGAGGGMSGFSSSSGGNMEGDDDNQTGEVLMTTVTGGVGSGSGQSNQVPCVTFILLHYFHLTNFFWMFVEGLYLYVLVVKTFVSENIKLRVYACIGWGIPFAVVIAWSIAKWMTQSTDSADLQNTDPEFTASSSCMWLPVNDYDWIYKTPVILVLASNLIFLLQIMWVLITKLRSAMNPETQQSIKAAKALVVLMPLLGITYVLVLSGSRAPVYEYLRALLISTQGFLVALLYCFLNGEVRQAIRHRWNRLRMMGPACCDFEHRRRQNLHHMTRDWSPRSRTESIRYTCGTQHNYGKRESTISEATTVTTINSGTGSTGSGGGGYGHGFFNRATISPSPRRGIGQGRPPPSPLQLYQSHQQQGGGRGSLMVIVDDQKMQPKSGEEETECFNPNGVEMCNGNGKGIGTTFSDETEKY